MAVGADVCGLTGRTGSTRRTGLMDFNTCVWFIRRRGSRKLGRGTEEDPMDTAFGGGGFAAV